MAAKIARHFVGDILERTRGFDDRMLVSTVVEVEEAVRLVDVTNYMRLLLHHDNDQLGFEATLREQPARQRSKIIAIPAFALKKNLWILRLGIQLETEAGKKANQFFRSQVSLPGQIIKCATARKDAGNRYDEAQNGRRRTM